MVSLPAPVTTLVAVPPSTPLMLPLSGVVTIALLPTPTGGVLPVQGVPTVQAGSPPPETLAVLVPLVAVGPTVIGRRMTMVPLLAAVAIVQPVKLLPVTGQPLRVPPLVLLPCLVGAPDKVMPVGKVSVMLMAAVLGPLAIATVMS